MKPRSRATRTLLLWQRTLSRTRTEMETTTYRVLSEVAMSAMVLVILELHGGNPTWAIIAIAVISSFDITTLGTALWEASLTERKAVRAERRDDEN